MKSNYDILGNHIRLIDTRNRESITDRVLGINIDKFFMPSVANVIGTDLSKYKLITKGKFACNPMHVGRDERLPVALYDEEKPAIVSPAYFMFEVIDNSILKEDYLMMWFRRPEFDRICWLHTDGSVRGGITWDDICRLELPIPPIEKQFEIVNSYKAITERIALKQKINDNLEAQANAIFSSSAPDFTDLQPIHNFGTVITGKTPPTSVAEYYGNDIPFIKTPDMHGNVYITSSECSLSKAGADSQKNKYIPENTVVVACIGANAGEVALTSYIAQTNQQINAIISKYPCFLYFSIKAHTVELRTLGEGSSTMININKTSFENYEIPTPSDNTLQQLEHKLNIIFSAILHNLQEIDRLNETKDLLVTQLSR